MNSPSMVKAKAGEQLVTEYDLISLSPGELRRWDELVMSYPGYEVFHRQAWLNYLAESRQIELCQLQVVHGRQRVGLLCGGLIRKGPFRIFGTPLKGWATNTMGALLDSGVHPAALVEAINRFAGREHLAMVEFEQRGFPDQLLEDAGFEATEAPTYWVELSPNKDQMLKRLHKGRRSGVKKAIASGLQVEVCTTPEIADEFYDQFTLLMRNKDLVPGFPRTYPQLLCRDLQQIGRIFALRVRHPDGAVLATGLFPFDNRTLYYWGGADALDGRRFCPNDFLHWSAMCLGAERGLTLYDMSGFGKFKREFGGILVTTRRWHKCYSPAARWGRRAYARWYREQSRFRAWIQSHMSGVSRSRTADDGGEE